MINTANLEEDEQERILLFIKINFKDFVTQNIDTMVNFLSRGNLPYFNQILAIDAYGKLIIDDANNDKMVYGAKRWSYRILRHHATNKEFANKILLRYVNYLRKEILAQRKDLPKTLAFKSEPVMNDHCYDALYTADAYARWVINNLDRLTGSDINANYVGKSKIYPQLLLTKLQTLKQIDNSIYNALVRIVIKGTQNTKEVIVIKKYLKDLLSSNKITNYNNLEIIDYYNVSML